MVTRRARVLVSLVVAIGTSVLPVASGTRARAQAPSNEIHLSDQEYWTLISDLSEANGTFRSDNLLSNESRLQYVIPESIRASRPGGAYVGVGPEQNFTLIAALKPSLAFIVDIRRGNLHLHLLYKALFALSADWVEFLSRLFSRARPKGLDARSTPAEIFAAYLAAEPDEALYHANLKAVASVLVDTHRFALSNDDLSGIEYVYNAFFTYGPSIQYSSSDGAAASGEPTYADLMLAADATGQQRSYLASDEAFSTVRDLEDRNALVPLVGNFAGPKTLRAVGAYLRSRNMTVEAFYVSNVEQYLRLFRSWPRFCANTQKLPVDEMSVLVRAGRGGRIARGSTLTAELAPIAAEVQSCGNNRF